MKTYQVIWRLLRASPASAAAALLLSVAAFGLPIPLGLVTRAFFDTLTGAAPAGVGIGAIIALFVVTEAFGLLANAGLSFAWGSLLQSGMALLRHNLLRAVMQAPAAVALAESSGAAISRFRDDAEEIVESIDAWLDLAGRSVTVVIALAIMLGISVRVTMVAFLPLVAIAIAVNQAKGPIAAYRLRSRAALAGVTGFLADLVGAVQVVQASGASQRALARLEALNERRRVSALRDHVFAGLLDGFNLNIVNLGAGILLLAAARAMRSGAVTIGDFALVVTYLETLIWFGDEIARWLLGYRQTDVSFARLTALVPFAPPAAIATHRRPRRICCPCRRQPIWRCWRRAA